MENVFLKLFNMSVSAGWVILVVLILRWTLKSAPKNFRLLLWAVVAFRLTCPVSFESVLSMIPSAEILATGALYDQTPELSTGIPVLNDAVNPVFTQSFAVEGLNGVNPLQIAVLIAANLWILGMVVMLLYGVVSYLILRRKVTMAIWLRENIWLCDHIPTSFILGYFRAKIYLPSDMPKRQYEPVISHEQAHLKHRDHWIKLLGFVLLCVHWFNPLVWAAYILLCRDIELACDERVIRAMDDVQKRDYCDALLVCSVQKHRVSACPLAFGEVGVKERIKAVLDYKKPALWIVVISVVTAVVVCICFLPDPIADPNIAKTESIDKLRKRVPEYFGLDTFKGLEVYVWEEQGELYCGVLCGTNRNKTEEDIASMTGVTLGAMSKILDTYDIPDWEISVIPIGESSYWTQEQLSNVVLRQSVKNTLRKKLDLYIRMQGEIVLGFTIIDSGESFSAFGDGYFYAEAYDGLYRVYCSDMAGLREGQLLEMAYIDKKDAAGGQAHQYEITATRIYIAYDPAVDGTE